MDNTQLEVIITQLIQRVVMLENEMKMLKGIRQTENVPASIQYLNQIPNEVDTIKTEYPSVDTAPKWLVTFNVSTSKGIIKQELIQNAYTEKQALFLSRTEQLFPTINEYVKQKLIEPKWKIAGSVAEKIV